ncbi:MAG: cobyrinate a,c-diamide synthase [Eubacterium sp.]|nr:cobyrinate a,c-diamide synthase [Eubacterium sp.]MBQ9022504.1 cobyrinate a,c-diamide synthase [Eubacterium sp.]
MSNIPRILLAAPASGSGKTVITCALLRAFQKEGLKLASFKCGPDYIDPLFHEQVFEIETRNLDPFFSDENELRGILKKGSSGKDLSIIEGVMGYYDGLGGVSTEGSAYDVATKIKAPVILIINAKGASVSLAAQIRGFLEFRKDHGICGVILNRVTKGMFPLLKTFLESELGIQVFGYFPVMEEAQFESRHLGLLLPDEVQDISARLDALADVCRETVDLEAIQKVAEGAEILAVPKAAEMANLPEKVSEAEGILPMQGMSGKPRVRIAVARDEAFCFYYHENLDLLEALGAEIVKFSPLHDTFLPEGIQGILLGGGYPELYAKQLSENVSMRMAIRNAIAGGMPTLAECGGFMYLMQQMEDMEGNSYEMCGALPGKAWRTTRLQRFGYITLTAQEASMAGPAGTQIRAHEFHYFDTDLNGDVFQAKKPTGKREWDCMIATETMLAGFPHLYYPSNPEVAERFLDRAVQFGEQG